MWDKDVQLKWFFHRKDSERCMKPANFQTIWNVDNEMKDTFLAENETLYIFNTVTLRSIEICEFNISLTLLAANEGWIRPRIGLVYVVILGLVFSEWPKPSAKYFWREWATYRWILHWRRNWEFISRLNLACCFLVIREHFYISSL